MPAPKTLEEHCRDVTWRARLPHHRELLAGPVVPWPRLAAIQASYVATDHELEQRQLAIMFERATRELSVDEDEKAERAAAAAEFEALLAEVEVLDVEQLGRDLDRWHNALIVRDCRAARVPWRTIAEQLETTIGKARRLLGWFDRQPRAVQ